MDNKLIMLRVLPGILLPHTISKAGVTYVFAPDAEVPEKLAQSLLKTYPGTYESAKGKPDIHLYEFGDEFKNKSIEELVQLLAPEQKLKVLAFVKGFLTGTEETAEGNLDQLNKNELLTLCSKLPLDVLQKFAGSHNIDPNVLLTEDPKGFAKAFGTVKIKELAELLRATASE